MNKSPPSKPAAYSKSSLIRPPTLTKALPCEAPECGRLGFTLCTPSMCVWLWVKRGGVYLSVLTPFGHAHASDVRGLFVLGTCGTRTSARTRARARARARQDGAVCLTENAWMLLNDETDAGVRVQLSRLINVKGIAWGRTGNANMDRCATVLDPDRDKRYCELCGKMQNLLKCGRCRISFYCSKDHQKQHWKKHKLTCREADKTQIVPQTPHQQDKPADPDRTESSTKPQTHNLATDYLVPCMNKHGICVVDNFLSEELGLSILEDVKALHQTGRFTDGQLVSQKSDSTRDIRGDQITWIEGKEPGCEKIRFLMSRMDDLVRNCNGKLGNYTINGRTKVSIDLLTPAYQGCIICFEELYELPVSVQSAHLKGQYTKTKRSNVTLNHKTTVIRVRLLKKHHLEAE